MDIMWLFILFSLLFFSLINLKTFFFSVKHLLLVLGIAVICLLFNVFTLGFAFSIVFFSLLFSIMYCIGVSALFREEILPEITIRSVHITALIYSYTVLAFANGKFKIFIIIISVIPLGAILYYAIFQYGLSNKEKTLLYYWYLIMLIIIQILHFMIFKNKKLVAGWPDITDFIHVFFLTGILFYIMIYDIQVFGIFMLDISQEEIQAFLEEQAELFQNKFCYYQASSIGSIILTLIIGSTIILNVFYKIIDPVVLSQLILIISLIFTSLENKIHITLLL